jgi:NAD-dependent SIR2 family protein deacetylase
MKRQKRLTKRERKASNSDAHHEHQHIHCIACGRHIDGDEFSASPPTAKIIACQHGSKFPVCAACVEPGKQLLAEHDRTGQPVQTAGAWH